VKSLKTALLAPAFRLVFLQGCDAPARWYGRRLAPGARVPLAPYALVAPRSPVVVISDLGVRAQQRCARGVGAGRCGPAFGAALPDAGRRAEAASAGGIRLIAVKGARGVMAARA
jgi:hypothetical protein